MANRSSTISYKNKKRIKLGEKDWIKSEQRHEAIISRELFEMTRAIRKTRKRPGKTGKRYLLSGALRCGYCGSNLIVSSTPTETRCYYACHHHRVNPAECPGINVSEKTVQDRIAILHAAKRYIDAEILTREMIVELVDYIVVMEGDGYGVKNIEIHWKF